MNIYSIVANIENTINLNYNRKLKLSPISVIKHYDAYDPCRRVISYKPSFKEEFIKLVRIGDYCSELKYNARKLEPKFGKYKQVEVVSRKGYWVKLKGNKDWIHIRNIKL